MKLEGEPLRECLMTASGVITVRGRTEARDGYLTHMTTASVSDNGAYEPAMSTTFYVDAAKLDSIGDFLKDCAQKMRHQVMK